MVTDQHIEVVRALYAITARALRKYPVEVDVEERDLDTGDTVVTVGGVTVYRVVQARPYLPTYVKTPQPES